MEEKAVIEIIRSVATNELAKNVRRYKYRIVGKTLSTNMMGFSTDYKPVEGKVVYYDELLTVLREGSKAVFVAFDNEILPEDAKFAIGEKVIITPYARRRFDGSFLYEPFIDEYGASVIIIGDNTSKLPIDKKQVKSQYLLDLMDLIENGKSSSYRTIGQVLIDAGTCQEAVQFNDPSDEAVISSPPALTFRIESQKLSGYLTIFYDRGADYYGIKVLDTCGTEIDVYPEVDFSTLAGLIEDLVDDRQWVKAKVEHLSAAKKAKVKKTASL